MTLRIPEKISWPLFKLTGHLPSQITRPFKRFPKTFTDYQHAFDNWARVEDIQKSGLAPHISLGDREIIGNAIKLARPHMRKNLSAVLKECVAYSSIEIKPFDERFKGYLESNRMHLESVHHWFEPQISNKLLGLIDLEIKAREQDELKRSTPKQLNFHNQLTSGKAAEKPSGGNGKQPNRDSGKSIDI